MLVCVPCERQSKHDQEVLSLTKLPVKVGKTNKKPAKDENESVKLIKLGYRRNVGKDGQEKGQTEDEDSESQEERT